MVLGALPVGMAAAEAWSLKGRPRHLAILPQEAQGQGTCTGMFRVGSLPGVGQEVGWRAD